VRASLAAVATLLLAGCGFHLQGAGALPSSMMRTFVGTQRPHSEFLVMLTDVLRQRGAEVLAAPADGAAVLDIVTDETGQRVLSVSARNIPREYEVFYAVTFSLRVGSETLLSNESLVVTRAYTYDETQVLAKAAEEEILRKALAEDLARRVMQRIQALGATAAIGPR
jgi:LPS-assembly lipoprotein